MMTRVKWGGEALFTVEFENGHDYLIDATSKNGPSPMETVLAGVAACDALIVLQILQVMRQKVDAIEVEAVGTKEKNAPEKFENVKLHYTLKGKNLADHSIERALELSEAKYCPVVVMLKEGGVQISSTYTAS